MMIATVLQFGCAPKTAEVSFVYPSLPEEPRIAFLKFYTGDITYQKSGFFDFLFGTQGTSMGQLYGVAAKNGKVYGALFRPPAVVAFDDKEQRVTYLGTRGTGVLSLPTGIALGDGGAVYVADAQEKKIQVYTSEGVHTRSIGNRNELNNPAGIAINNKLQRLYIVESREHKVKVYSLQGAKLFEFGAPGSEKGQFNGPTNVAVNNRTNAVYVVDTMNFRIQVFDQDGKFLRTFGTPGDLPGQFSRPKGIGIDSEDHVYVVDSAFGNITIFDEGGVLLLYFGNYGQGPAEFMFPAGLYIDQDDKIFVADSGNHRIQSFQYLSEKWKKGHPEEYKKYLELQANPEGKQEGKKEDNKEEAAKKVNK